MENLKEESPYKPDYALIRINATAAKSTYTQAPAYHQGTYLFWVAKCHKSHNAWANSPTATKMELLV